MILYHASKETVEFPEVQKTRYTKDFSRGFYCTNNFEQAVRWANCGDGEPIINYYSYEPNDKLSVRKFGYWQNSDIQRIRLVFIHYQPLTV